MIYDKMVVFEGLNGSGKATQAKMLADFLGKETLVIEFPNYSSDSGKLITKYLHEGKNKENTFYNALLYELNRYDLLPLMEKQIEKKQWLVLDRYFYSNWVFQGIFANNPEFLDWLKQIEKFLPKPKYVIFLDVPVEYTIKLMKDKKKDWHESDVKYMRKVYDTFKKLAKDEKWIVINCVKGRTMKSKEEIHNEILKALKLS